MNKQKYINLGRTIGLLNTSIFRNPRTYVIAVLLPIVASVVLEFAWNKFSASVLTPPEMIGFMYIPIFIASFYIGIFSNEIRRNKFREKINIKIDNLNIIKFSMVVLAIEIAAINLCLVTILFYVISLFNVIGLENELFNNLMAFVWIYYVIFGIMLAIVSALVFLLIESALSSRVYSVFLMSIALIFMLFFSDTIIPSKIISNNDAMNVIGYFNPTKYVTWSMNLIGSYQFEDSLGKLQIYVPQKGSFEPFNMLWQTTVPSIVFMILLTALYSCEKEES